MNEIQIIIQDLYELLIEIIMKISADVRLRPTRIGFLTSPTDLNSIRRIMRINACLWGGRYNPIIPVFDLIPKDWKKDIPSKLKAESVTKGYINFFEPDVYVETEKGMAEKLGLSDQLRPTDSIITLTEFLSLKANQSWSELKFGSSMYEVLDHIYKTEQQFVSRDPKENLLINPGLGDCSAEALFGVYPDDHSSVYFENTYKGVFKPNEYACSPDVWRKVFKEGAITPLIATSHGLTFERRWSNELIIFIFDSSNPVDLIDLWNIKLESGLVLPVPVEWFENLLEDIKQILKDEYQPENGYPNFKQVSTIQYSRSIKKEQARSIWNSLIVDVPIEAIASKDWMNPIWKDNPYSEHRVKERLGIYAEEKGIELAFEGNVHKHTTFNTLAPSFSTNNSFSHYGWVNVLKLNHYTNHGFAVVLPFNTFSRNWPRTSIGSGEVLVGKDGWVFQQTYPNHGQFLNVISPQQAIKGPLRELGIDAELSEPGNIAWQMIENLDGVWGASILADMDTLKLLNNMAVSLKRKSNSEDSIEESYAHRTASLKSWQNLISKRKQRVPHWAGDLSVFTESNIIKLGLETDCPHCRGVNWHTLTDADYKLVCERCLQEYKFPQASLKDRNRNFTYRVIGPFSVPDYGRGSYSAILALRLLALLSNSFRNVTFSTAMNLSFASKKCEVDLIAWYSPRLYDFGNSVAPRLVIGECKSLGQGELITSEDLDKLKWVASKLPDVIIIIAVLRDHFTSKEIKLLKTFAKWCRRRNSYDEPTNPILLLTCIELTADESIREEWKKHGGRHAQFADKLKFRDLSKLCDVTQQLHLDMPSFDDEKYDNAKKIYEAKLARKKLAQNKIQS